MTGCTPTATGLQRMFRETKAWAISTLLQAVKMCCNVAFHPGPASFQMVRRKLPRPDTLGSTNLGLCRVVGDGERHLPAQVCSLYCQVVEALEAPEVLKLPTIFFSILHSPLHFRWLDVLLSMLELTSACALHVRAALTQSMRIEKLKLPERAAAICKHGGVFKYEREVQAS